MTIPTLAAIAPMKSCRRCSLRSDRPQPDQLLPRQLLQPRRRWWHRRGRRCRRHPRSGKRRRRPCHPPVRASSVRSSRLATRMATDASARRKCTRLRSRQVSRAMPRSGPLSTRLSAKTGTGTRLRVWTWTCLRSLSMTGAIAAVIAQTKTFAPCSWTYIRLVRSMQPSRHRQRPLCLHQSRRSLWLRQPRPWRLQSQSPLRPLRRQQQPPRPQRYRSGPVCRTRRPLRRWHHEHRSVWRSSMSFSLPWTRMGTAICERKR
mmetsp:Transcript_54358/g.118914  ORF Transcript_54358/g.118914 Transcript_54358/m.118914 type:complete len:261 (-) Transcript_54358:1600-2382(-)